MRLMIISLALVFVAGCAFMMQDKTPVLNWDLSKDLHIRNVGWSPKREDSEIYSETGDMTLKLKLPNGKLLNEEIRFFVCDRRGSEVSEVTLHIQKKNVDGAYQDAQRLIKLLDLPYKDLDEWYAGIKSGDHTKDVAFYSINNNSFPSVELNIRHSFNDEKPWFVSVWFFFPERGNNQ